MTKCPVHKELGHDPQDVCCCGKEKPSPQSVNDWARSDFLINEFIKYWCLGNAEHLLDSDENDGEKLRIEIRKLIIQSRAEAIREAMGVVKERITDLQVLVGSEDTRHYMHDAQMKLDEAEAILSALTSLAKDDVWKKKLN